MSIQTPVAALDRGLAGRLYTGECLEAVDRWTGSPSSPAAENRRREGIRVFRTGWIEHGLSKAHPITPLLWTGPIMVYGLVRGVRESGLGAALALFATGIILWTLLEYVLHRFVFHLRPLGPDGKMRAFLLHGYHHEFPNDKMRLVAPPLMGWTLALIVGSLYALLFGRFWAPLFAGTAAGYLAYDWLHYYAHHFTPKHAVGKWIRRYHLLHHFQDSTVRYGISSPLWDLVFRTFRSPEDGQTPAEA